MPTEQSSLARAPWHVTVLTIFPEMFPGPLGASLVGTALAGGLWRLSAVNIREFGLGRHRQVDDTPAGGGAGMVMRPDVLGTAIDHADATTPGLKRIFLSPRGAPLTQAKVKELAQGPGVMLLAGRFEGVDQRLIDARQLEEISIGDYVLSGGEIAAMVLIDACVRLLPGVLGADASLEEESFESGLLEYPQYTKPREWEGRRVPDILVSGDHQKVATWRRAEAERLTAERRPDLLRTAKPPNRDP